MDKHTPIKYLQLVEASIMKGEYPGFYVANVYQELRTFDEKLCKFDERVLEDGLKDKTDWNDTIKIVLDTEVLSKIPLEERLVYRSAEVGCLTLWHESVVDIMKSTKPIGMAFVPVEEWYKEILYRLEEYTVAKS